MPLKIERSKWLSGQDSVNGLIGWFLLHSMGDSGAGECVNTGEKIKDSRGQDDTIDTITLLLNGVELDVTDCFRSLNAQMDDMITRKAKELLSEKFGSLSSLLIDLESKLTDQLTKDY